MTKLNNWDNLVIIPAAGFGTRMNMVSNQSKEMLLDPNTGDPLIKWSLDISSNYNQMVILREEKQDLYQYLKQNYPNVSIGIVSETKSWQDTIMKLSFFWKRNNLILLPDIRFNPVSSINKCFNLLQIYDTVAAVHTVIDPENFGIIFGNNIIEKPKYFVGRNAWGLLGFNKKVGEKLLTETIEYNKIVQLPNFKSFKLKKFIDLTRTGTLEKY